MNRQLRRILTLVAAAVLSAGGAGTLAPATAAPGAPVGQCPPVYTLTEATFGPATLALDLGSSGNRDGWICRKVFVHGPNAGIANIVDNDVPLGVTFR